jgi:hypothetical protein
VLPQFCGEDGVRGPCGLGHIDITESDGKLLTYDFYSDVFPQFNSSGLAHDLLNDALDNGVPTYNVDKNGEQGLHAWQLSHPTGVAYAEFIDTFPGDLPTYSLFAERAVPFTQFRDTVTNTFFPGSFGFWQTENFFTQDFSFRGFEVLSVEGLPLPVPEPSGLALLASACGLWFAFSLAKRRRLS